MVHIQKAPLTMNYLYKDSYYLKNICHLNIEARETATPCYLFKNFLLWNTLLQRKWRQCGAIVSYILSTIGQQVFYLFILWTISIVLCYGKNKIFDWMVPMLILLNAWKWLNFLIVICDCQLETRKVKIESKNDQRKGKNNLFFRDSS